LQLFDLITRLSLDFFLRKASFYLVRFRRINIPLIFILNILKEPKILVFLFSEKIFLILGFYKGIPFLAINSYT